MYGIVKFIYIHSLCDIQKQIVVCIIKNEKQYYREVIKYSKI